MNDTLTLPLKAEYFDAIKHGTKRTEYRLVTPYWTKRLAGRHYHHVVLTRGYPKASDSARRLVRTFGGCTVETITHPHFGPDPMTVFAIDVSETAKTAEARNGL